ncbi:hypothetical protein HDZ31DRAFT_64286 [Schizophyllum fasciatum]
MSDAPSDFTHAPGSRTAENGPGEARPTKKQVAFSADAKPESSASQNRPPPKKPLVPLYPEVDHLVYGFLVSDECIKAFLRKHDFPVPDPDPDPSQHFAQVWAMRVIMWHQITAQSRERFPCLPRTREMMMRVTDGVRPTAPAVVMADNRRMEWVYPPPDDVVKQVAEFLNLENVKPRWFLVVTRW